MNAARASLPRRFAFALMTHAADILPPARSAWADAMKQELHHIDSDFDAVTWAAGCVLASYVERTQVLHAVQSWFVRAPLALLIATQVLSMLFATVLTVAYRLDYLRLAAFMGGFTPGDDYRRFIPLMDATPWWNHALWIGASVLFLASGLQLLRNRASAFALFAVAWVLGAAGNMMSQSTPEYREVFSFSAPLFARDYLIPAMTACIPVLIAAALWAHGRCSLADGTPTPH
jgi:hypothetical protein